MQKPDWQRVMFLVAIILFLVEVSEFMGLGAVSAASTVISVIISAVFIVYSTAYLLCAGTPRKYKNLDKYMPYLFLSVLALFVLQLLFAIIYLNTSSYFFLFGLYLVLILVPIFLPIMLIALFGVSVWRSKVEKRYKARAKLVSVVLLVLAVAVLLFFFLSGYFTSNFYISDEEFINLNAAITLLSGHNPYVAQYGSMLFNYSTGPDRSTDYTFTTNNTFQGGVDYPALYAISSAPMLLLTNYKSSSPNYDKMVFAELSLFVAIAILTVAFVLKPEQIRRPPIAVLLFMLFFLTIFAAYTSFLMLALMLIAFYFIDSKYLWVVTGLAASLQEELWIAVLLFLVYSFRNYGIKRGTLNTLGTIAVFLVINAYFIAASPHAYISQVFAPINGYNLPASYAPFGYAVLSLYHVMLSSANVLFYASIISVAILFAYLNEKRLIFLFALIPLMFLFRAIAPYYSFFLVATVIALYIREKTTSKRRSRLLSRTVAISSVVAISLVSAAFLIISHNQFTGFGIKVTGQSLQEGLVANYTLYNAALAYKPGSLQQLSVIEYALYYKGGGTSFFGFADGNLLYEPKPVPVNSSTQYLVNPNRIYLNASGGLINMSLLIPTTLSLAPNSSGPSNSIPQTRTITARVYSAQCVLYSNSYYYICPAAYR